MEIIPEQYRMALDQLFSSYEVLSPGSFIHLVNLVYNFSKCSKSAVEYFNLPGEYLENDSDAWQALICPEDLAHYKQGLEEVYQNQNHRIQFRLRNRYGHYVACSSLNSVIFDPRTKTPSYLCTIITKHEDYLDDTTGPRNQYGFMHDLQNVLNNHARCRVMMFGFRRFSSINDLYGYELGNHILRKTAKEIAERLGPYGTIYRLDGAKFAIITENLPVEKLQAAYCQMQEQCQHGFEIDGQKPSLTCNGSLAEVSNFSISYRTLFSGLHRAYHISKHEREGDLVTFGDLETIASRDQIQVLSDISDSIANGCRGFSLRYQPIMRSQDHSLKGAEALLRWTDHDGRLIPPNDFIPLVEADPMFPILGRWIMRQAMIDGLAFVEKYPAFILNVNLSYTQVKRNDFVHSVTRLLSETGFPANNLCLEITERCRAVDVERLRNVVRDLRNVGVRFAIDDFGTGFSSIGLLKDIPVETIKIDRGFVQNISDNERDRKLIQCFNMLAELFDSDVCAEGVETEDLAKILRENGIRSLQGYLFSRPITYNEFVNNYIA